MNATLNTSETKVSDALVAEINSIGTESGNVVPSYEPQAWNHAGSVD